MPDANRESPLAALFRRDLEMLDTFCDTPATLLQPTIDNEPAVAIQGELRNGLIVTATITPSFRESGGFALDIQTRRDGPIVAYVDDGPIINRVRHIAALCPESIAMLSQGLKPPSATAELRMTPHTAIEAKNNELIEIENVGLGLEEITISDRDEPWRTGGDCRCITVTHAQIRELGDKLDQRFRFRG